MKESFMQQTQEQNDEFITKYKKAIEKLRKINERWLTNHGRKSGSEFQLRKGFSSVSPMSQTVDCPPMDIMKNLPLPSELQKDAGFY